MSSKVIATVLNLKDNFSETIKKTTSNTAAFAREVKQAESTISKLKGGITGAFSSTGAKIAGLVGGLGIAKFATDSLMLASDLAEVQNVVDTTFKDSASTINDFAKSTSTQFGISELQAKKFSGTLGAMLKSAGFTGDELTTMSTSLASLSGDIASFYNLDPQEAFDKLKSGISGETEPLKALGVDISDTTTATYALANGFKKQWKEATQSEKQLWRYKAIMSQTKDAQGDYAKTATGFANQLRTMKLNFQTLGATIMSYAIPPFQNLFTKVNDFITKIDIKGFIDGMIDKFNQVKPTIDTFVDSFTNFAKTIWTDIQPAIEWIKKNVVPKNWDDVKASIEGILTKATEVVNYINDNWGTIAPIVGSIATAILEWKLALMAVEFWTKAVTIVTKAWETLELMIWGIKNATNAWELAQWALNVAMDANPVGVVIVGLGLLSLAIYEVVMHWKEICEWTSKAWEFLKTNPIAAFILDCVPFVNVLYEIAKHWTAISDGIKSAWDWLTSWNSTKMEDKKANAYTTPENSKNTNTEKAFNSNLFGGVTTSFGMNLGANATGTNYWKGGLTKKNEHGDEIIDLPSGSRVYTASQSKQMLNSNSGINVNVNISGNVIGNEQYADYVGDHIMNRLRVAFINQ